MPIYKFLLPYQNKLVQMKTSQKETSYNIKVHTYLSEMFHLLQLDLAHSVMYVTHQVPYLSCKFYLPRFGQTFAKCDGSPQIKHLPDIGSPVADTNATPFARPPPWLPRPPLLLELDAETLAFARGKLLPPFMLSSHLHPPSTEYKE